MELIKAIKPHLDQRYVVAAPSADLYAYFYERGVGILRDGGRLGFITSSTFFRTSSGEALRNFLTNHLAIETIVDFGDAQVFDSVTTYPVAITLLKGQREGVIRYLILDRTPPLDLGRAFDESAQTLTRARLAGGSWQLENETTALLRDKIADHRVRLSEVWCTVAGNTNRPQ